MFSATFLLLLITSKVHGTYNFTTDRNELPVDNVIGRLGKLIAHYKDHPESLNVDGLFGFRIAEGELAQTASYLQLERATSPYTAHTEKLLRDISKINNQAQQKISLENPDYFKAFQPLMVGEFHISTESYSRLPAPDVSEFMRHASHQHTYNEPHGDICYQKLMGTYNLTSMTKAHAYKCYIDADCLHMMTLPNQKLYSLTHQLLYFIIAKKECFHDVPTTKEDKFFLGAQQKNNKIMRAIIMKTNEVTKTLQEWCYTEKVSCNDVVDMLLHPRNSSAQMRVFCTSILVQNEWLLLPGGYSIDSTRNVDLFMEQALLCGGLLHYSNFLEDRRVKAALEYQDRGIGCYGIPLHKNKLRGSALKGRMTQRLRIQKRIDKVDKDHCRAHPTGLAAGYMAAYLHYKLTDGESV